MQFTSIAEEHTMKESKAQMYRRKHSGQCQFWYRRAYAFEFDSRGGIGD